MAQDGLDRGPVAQGHVFPRHPVGNRGGRTLLGLRNTQEISMFKFIGGVAGIIFLIGLLVVIGILSLIF